MRRILSFPETVSETSARLVATGVVLQALAFLVVRSGWVLLPLTFGFLARVASGPRFSPLGLLVTKVIAPRLSGEARIVPGPPKRFAQGIGAVFTVSASVAWLFGAHTVSYVLVAGLLGAASLEAFAGFCLGCVIFGRLMRWGVIPDTTCEECNDISRRLGIGTQV